MTVFHTLSRVGTLSVDNYSLSEYASAGSFLNEDFSGPTPLNAWTVVNQGTEQGPSNWRVANQELAQTSNIYSNTPGVAGTHIYYTGGFGWTDYSASTTLRSTDNDVLGLMFRYQDQNNHYRFIMSSENGFRRLERVAGGVVTVLATDNVAYTPNKKYYLTVSAIGSVLQASVNGTPVFTVTDSTFPSGTIAAFSSYNAGSYFDNLTVTDRSGETPPTPEPEPTPEPIATSSILLDAGFNSDAALNAWTVVNQGTEQGPSNWRVANQELAQTSNIYSNTPGVAGTHIYYTGGFGWTDYSASTTLRSTDNDVLGLMFRYQDQNNHYRFIMSSENGFRRLERVAGGVVTVLATDNVAYTPNKKYYLTVSAIGSVLQASVNGTPVFTVTDSTFPSGTIAAFSSYNAGSYFDNLTVTDRSGEPAPDPIVDPAPDPVAGNLIANPSLESQAGLNQPYSWSSSFWGTNNALFTYPVAGYSSPRAATVQITDYTDGEARWYFDDVPVTGGGKYLFSNYYRSNVPTTITVRYQTASGTDSFIYSGTTDLPPTTDWQKYEQVISVPSEATMMTVFHTLSRVGTLSVDNYSLSEYASAGSFLNEDFSGPTPLNAWTVVNQGTEQGPSNWRVANQELAQTSNIYSNTPGVAGTHIYYTGGFGWTDYSASTTLRSTDNDVLGLMFRYQDQNNHYRFIMSSENGFRRLERVAGGVVTVLATDNVAYTPNKKYYLTVSAIGSVLQASVNGAPVFTVTDSTFPSGTIAAFSSYNAGSYFDNLTVTDRSGETPPTPEPEPEPTPDTTAPVITLLGNNPVDIAAGDVYNDAGATAIDDVDGDITAQIITVNPVDTGATGTYTVTYNVADAAGNPAAEVTRTVNVTNQDLVSSKQATATIFWIGEPADQSNGFITNTVSAWDDDWVNHYGGVDDPADRCGYLPCSFTPLENPFYVALPYNDLDNNGDQKASAASIPWYQANDPTGSLLKNHWVELKLGSQTCYAQWEDVGPFEEDDFSYVFGNAAPLNTNGVSAGLDLSPAAGRCLGLDNVDTVKWRFIDETDVPAGPWTDTITTSSVYFL